MSGKDFDVEEGQEVVGRTIVGGRPAAYRKRRLRVPIGIEKVLVRAAADEEFRRMLLSDRERALTELGDDLTPTERTVLTTIPRESLLQMVGNIDLQRHGKKRFMRGVLTAALITSTATVSLLGLECCSTGAMPDWPEDIDVRREQTVDAPTMDSRGVQPDVTYVEDVIKPDSNEPDVIDFSDLPAPGGILPDMDEQK